MESIDSSALEKPLRDRQEVFAEHNFRLGLRALVKVKNYAFTEEDQMWFWLRAFGLFQEYQFTEFAKLNLENNLY